MGEDTKIVSRLVNRFLIW